MAQVIEMSTVKEDFAERLRARRAEMGLTQQGAVVLLTEIVEKLAYRTYQSWEDPKDGALPDGKNSVAVFIQMGVPLVGANRPLSRAQRTRAKGPYPAAALAI